MNQVMNMGLALPAGSLEAYIQSVNQVPILSAEEEKELARRFREEDSIEAARRLIMSHLRFVVRVARGYSGYGLPQADLIQEGNIGLMKAVKRFDPDVGVRLVSFAVHWVRAEIHEFVIRNWRIVKIATTKAQRKLFFNLRSSKKRLGWLNNDEVNAVAKDLGVKPGEVLEMEKRLGNCDASLDGTTAGKSEEHVGRPAAYYLEDKRVGPEQQLELEQSVDKNRQALQRAMAGLNARSKDIISRRWLAENKVGLKDLAAEYKVSAERIRQIEKSAMQKLRESMQARL